MQFVKSIGELFQNMDGSASSRRVAGLALVVVAIVGFFMGRQTELVLAFLGTGGTLLGLTTADPHPPA